MPRTARARSVRGVVIAGLGIVAAACGDVPTEITPLPRAIGEVQGVLLQVTQLQPLDPATEGVYNLWALLERSETQHLGEFYVDATENIIDEAGNPILQFTSDALPLRKTLGVLVTVEVQGASGDQPNGFQILSGTVIDGVARMSVPTPSAVFSATGSLRVFTPTDGPGTNETSGVWMMDLNGAPSLGVPDTTAALLYEIFVDVGGQSINIGRFDFPNQADDLCRFCSELIAPPAVPGDDLLMNAPEGLAFPIDLGGARVTISLEARRGDFFSRSQLVVLEAIIPPGVAPDAIVPFVNRADSFPLGRAVLY